MATTPHILTIPADVWVLPPPAVSRWFPRIDWYLNWQLCKGLAFERQRPSVELFRIMEDGAMPFQDTPDYPRGPLMVISDGRVASGKCVVLAYPGDLNGWLQDVLQVLTRLQASAARVFLPAGATVTSAHEIWQKFPANSCITDFSTDEEAHD